MLKEVLWVLSADMDTKSHTKIKIKIKIAVKIHIMLLFCSWKSACFALGYNKRILQILLRSEVQRGSLYLAYISPVTFQLYSWHTKVKNLPSPFLSVQ